VLLYGFVPPELGAIFGYPVPLPPSVVISTREAAQERFGELNGGFDWEGRPHEAQFVDGDPAGELLERSGPGDLIVLGSPERGLLARALLGGVTTGVLRGAEVPVLALRPTLDND
jgi:nucleotide-binding universal stress UspA family protein